ncbi:MAG: single-stranded DNA-binding protein [Bacteroidales bacterium]
MKTSENKIMLIGRLGADPVIRRFETGQRMARLTLATHETKRNLEGSLEKMTNWHHLIAWGPTADIIKQMLRKGRRIAIEGRLNERKWKDKTGADRQQSEVVVKDFTLLQ